MKLYSRSLKTEYNGLHFLLMHDLNPHVVEEETLSARSGSPPAHFSIHSPRSMSCVKRHGAGLVENADR